MRNLNIFIFTFFMVSSCEVVEGPYQNEINNNGSSETILQKVLIEDFTYEDGSEEQRIWTLMKADENRWVGSADGVVGTAEGRIAGDMFYWAYTIDLPTPSGERRVSFKDYMWMFSDNRVLNKAYMSKWGIPLGEVTIMFEKN